jgi:hypothetical protein
LLEHATKPTTDEQKNHRQMSLFGTAPRQVTGSFGDNSDYAEVMNKFTTDPTNDEQRPLCDQKWEEGGAAKRRQARFARQACGGDQQL